MAALLALAAPTPGLGNSGVAFVHGTSNQSDALNDYWEPDYVNGIRQGLPNPANYVVINCNFDAYAWTAPAVGCLAEQLDAFIAARGITDMVVITHSHGANVMRWILSNPTWDARHPGIIDATREVYAVAGSSLGTPLADAVVSGTVFEQIVGWLLGYASDAVRMQQVSWMAYFNSTWLLGTAGRPTLPRAMTNIVGTDVDSAIWDPDSYCGGYSLNVGLEVTQLWLDSCSD
ncbi:MAG: hypothetical protein AAGD86_01785, partial [Pseudomonadota bacterium]